MLVIFKQANPGNYKSGRTDGIKYIVIHYTANNGDTAKGNVDYYANSVVEASAHYYVDEYADVYQSVKEQDTAWAVGGTNTYIHPYCRNANSISIEMCSRNSNFTPPTKPSSAIDTGWYIKPETVENAIRLTKELMKKYNIPIENVLRHYDVWGKICPAPFVNNPEQWLKFKHRLIEEDAMNKYSYDTTVDNMIKDGVTNTDNMAYWEKALDGREPLNKDFVRTILDRYHYKLTSKG